MPISAPALLSADHDTSQFRCQHESLTLWLQKHALTNNGKRGSRTHVVCDGRVSSVFMRSPPDPCSMKTRRKR